VVKAEVPAVNGGESYTYGDYKTWGDGRWELIDGSAFDMSPSPGAAHQSVHSNLMAALLPYFIGAPCRVFSAPFDVLFPVGDLFPLGGENPDDIATVLEPDIMILCDMSKLRPYGILGAPDVVFEILSPSTSARDLNDKLLVYERGGVKEYIVVDPDNRIVTAYRRGDGSPSFNTRAVYRESDMLDFRTFPALNIRLANVFDVPVFSQTLQRRTKWTSTN
jgi:Uma2 family endonuclease